MRVIAGRRREGEERRPDPWQRSRGQDGADTIYRRPASKDSGRRLETTHGTAARVAPGPLVLQKACAT